MNEPNILLEYINNTENNDRNEYSVSNYIIKQPKTFDEERQHQPLSDKIFTKKPRGWKFKDLTGIKFNRWLVIGYSGKKGIISYWHCKCDCGNENEVQSCALVNGTSGSCGCFKKDWLNDRQLNTRSYSTILEASINHVLIMYKSNAKKRNLEWNISKEKFIEITQMNCHYCGSPPSRKDHRIFPNGTIDDNFIYNGLDRVDSNKHYEESNVVPCCTMCNIAKHDYSFDEFLNWIKRVYNHTFNKQNNLMQEPAK